MGLILATVLAMAAFAANSVLNRMAVGQELIGPVEFAVVRLVAGAAMLGLLVALRGGTVWPGWPGRVAGVAGLSAYLFGFSLAYLDLDAGTGALLLFGTVQVTMFAGALAGGEPVPRTRWLGAALAFAGLALMMAPGASAPSLPHAGLMVLAGIGWGTYSLAGRGTRDALASTGWNFLLSVPLGLSVLPLAEGMATAPGLWLAVLSGTVTSGLGYALWYAVLPRLGATRAAVAQLSVPMIAAAGGALLLAEPVGLRLVLAAALVIGGVTIALGRR
jgi:drug/metabolite transporter (DMT)-like permease